LHDELRLCTKEIGQGVFETTMLAVSRVDPQQAFQAGLAGRGFAALDGTRRGMGADGASQAAYGELLRIPGITAAREAWETGRVLHAVAVLLERARAPAAVGAQFRDNLIAAVIAHHARRSPQVWGAEETVAMFMELYARVLGEDDPIAGRLRQALLAYATDERAPLPGARATPPGGPLQRRLFARG
jgi:hypothetical protein